MIFNIIIPARYNSMRLPGKPLIDINGKPMIIHVFEHACASGAERVIVATDHEEIANVIKAAGGEVCITKTSHKSGTERLAEAVDKYYFSDDAIIVNVQSDEPAIPAMLIRQVAKNLIQQNVCMTTLAIPICNKEEIFNPNIVKVVLDAEGYALYFSRSTIPWKDKFDHSIMTINNSFLRHLGIYGYFAGFIRRYNTWQPSSLEQIEMLEQLRVLWYGEKIHVSVVQQVTANATARGVNTKDDVERIRTVLI